MKYENEKEIKDLWEYRRRFLIKYFRGLGFGHYSYGIIHGINEDVKDMISSERWEFLQINGGCGSFWGSVKKV